MDGADAVADAPDTSAGLDLSGLHEAAWLARAEALGEEHGSAERLGDRHHAVSLDAGPDLLVTCDALGEARAASRGLPIGGAEATARGWSQLWLLADGATWFRDEAVWAHVDRLVDDGFFDEYRRVLFVGSGPGGYAAAAFSVAAPGARVLAFAPQATLDPGLAGWDARARTARRADFRSRYGYAPDMIDGARRAWVVHDPTEPLDAMHASLFHRRHVDLIRARGAGADPRAALAGLGVLDAVIGAAMADRLDAASFARLWRQRRAAPGYRSRVMARRAAGLARASA